MHLRWSVRVVSLLFAVAAVTLIASPRAPAQTRRVIHIVMTSYKFDPSLFFVNEGDTVVLQLDDADPDRRGHSFNSPYLSKVDYTVTGSYKEGVAKDGTKYIGVEPGQKAEVTFVAKGTGQYGFACNYSNHASRGQTGAFVVWPAGYHPPTKQ